MVGLFSLPQHEFISNCRRGFLCGNCVSRMYMRLLFGNEPEFAPE